MSSNPMTYASTGVNYDSLDPFKIRCQARASATSRNSDRFAIKAIEDTRGESVFVAIVTDVVLNHYPHIGHVEEGLGTKNLVADAFRALAGGKTYYDHVAQCTVAMIVNDMITLGVAPVSLAMHLAVGDSAWFNDEQRVADLIEGWGNACDLAECIWSGGETPTLKGIIVPDAALLSGSAWGVRLKIRHDTSDDRYMRPENIKHGDLIFLLESSGVHANGLSLCRRIATEKLPQGYATRISDGRMYGEALLDSTHIYCRFIEACLDRGIKIKYGINITGHGWRKLMRARQSFAYVIDTLPKQLPIFDFIREHGPVTLEEAYGNLNMGAGFAIVVDPADADKVKQLHGLYPCEFPYGLVEAGYVEESPAKKVVIRPIDLEFAAGTLAVR